jgi:hypothetical protein
MENSNDVQNTANVGNEVLTYVSISCDTTEFIKYCKEARNKFVLEFWQNCGGAVNARVMAEDLLIAYDQLVQRVSSHRC